MNSLHSVIGNTPLVRLKRMAGPGFGEVLGKLEGQNPAGSVKDRPAFNMIARAEERGEISRGDTLIEATSGNTGIALAMVAAMKGYRMRLIMPDNMSRERRATMAVYGAETGAGVAGGGHGTRPRPGLEMQRRGEGRVLDQFSNPDNPEAHYKTTGPEIWRQTSGRITHFVSAMGTTGTIMGVSRYLKERNPGISILGVQPGEGASIPGIRRWPEAYLPSIFDASRVDRTIDVAQEDAEHTSRELARRQGVFAGVSSGGAVWAALREAAENPDAVVVTVICDRGDRYLSTGVFD